MSEVEGAARSTRELERQYRVVDQSLSMHASLRDAYEKRAFWLNTCQIGISLVLCILAFVTDALLEAARYDAARTRFLLGGIATVVLLLSITEFRVDWKSRAANHGEAVKRLGRLKAEYRQVLTDVNGRSDGDGGQLEDEYNRTMGRLPPIPEGRFAQLKAAHQFKIALSKRISLNPQAPTWYLRVLLRLEGVLHEDCPWKEKSESAKDGNGT